MQAHGPSVSDDGTPCNNLRTLTTNHVKDRLSVELVPLNKLLTFVVAVVQAHAVSSRRHVR